MTKLILEAKTLAQKIKNELKNDVAELKSKHNVTPGLCVVLVGEDPASQTYVTNKGKACEELGIYSRTLRLPATTSQEDLLKLVKDLNNDKAIHGILVQLPLPKHIDEDLITSAIDPHKDVDGFHPINVGLLFSGKRCPFMPCTPYGVIEILKSYKIELKGKDVVVIGRSNIAGKPMAILMLNENCTVTICHSKTKDLAKKCSQADIVIAAIGKPGFVTADMVRDGAIVIDIGINRVDGKLCGDVDYAAVAPKTAAITPVPGGVGAMTIAMLMKNTVNGIKEYHLG